MPRWLLLLATVHFLAGYWLSAQAEALTRLKYNHPGLVVDLGVGLWALPLPMDYDGDGDNDLVVNCHDVPSNGLWWFENPGVAGAGEVEKLPVFKPPVRVDRGLKNLTMSHVDGRPRVLSPGIEYVDFTKNGLQKEKKLPLPANIHRNKVRANQWKYADYDGDGALDVIVGVGDWTDYGWDDAFDSQGRWQRGPLHGYVYLLRNEGTTATPGYGEPQKLEADGAVIDVFGGPSPNLADFDGDGDLDLLCGEFLDRFTYFQNVGTRTDPRYAAPRRLTHHGRDIAMDLQMIVPVAIDWDHDGDMDLVVGQEDGRVALIEHTGGVIDGLPDFLPPVFFRQQADELKFGALVTPVSNDWDGDGDEDLICGNSAGYIGFIENLDGGNPPRWAAPKLLTADDQTVRIMAGENGSVQGPCEAKWGYTTLSIADWDADGLSDLVVNSIWGKVQWFRNVGKRCQPVLAKPQPVVVAWEGEPTKPAWVWWNPRDGALTTQWRTTPLACDFNGDALRDLVMLDHEGYLCLYPRRREGDQLVLGPPRRVFQSRGNHSFDHRHAVHGKGDGLLRLNALTAGPSGRRKFCLADWDGDDRADLFVNSTNVNVLRNLGPNSLGGVDFDDQGPVSNHRLAGHDTSPTVVDWNHDGRPDLLIGAEDGRFYYMENPAARQNRRKHAAPPARP